MSDLEVRIVDLEPMRVVSALGFGEHPEGQAWEMIARFAREHGIEPFGGEHRFFGFDNPSPALGSPNYGYEQWMTVGAEVQAEAPLEIKEISGGRYAVTRFKGLERIGETWQALIRWFEDSGYRSEADAQECLEELLTPLAPHGVPSDEEAEFDLYLPVGE